MVNRMPEWKPTFNDKGEITGHYRSLPGGAIELGPIAFGDDTKPSEPSIWEPLTTESGKTYGYRVTCANGRIDIVPNCE